MARNEFWGTGESKNYLRGAAGAILGAVLGAIPWALVSLAGWFVAWLGLLIGFLAKKGYELFGGKKGRPKIWIICIAAIFGVILGNVLADFIDFGQMIYKGELEDVTYSDIPELYVYWISDPEVLKSVLYSMGLGLVFGMLGLFSVFKEMRAEAKVKTQEDAQSENTAEEDKSQGE